MKKILGLTIAIVLVIGLVAGGTWAIFSDTETSAQNAFTAGTIDISLDPSDGQDVVTLEGYVDLKPCQTGYTYTSIHNDGTNPADIWKHIADVVNEENLITEPEQAYYTANPGSEAYLISNWIHYDLLACKPFEETYDTIGEDVVADIVKEWVCCTTTWTVDITSVNAPHGVYGIGLVISTDGSQPGFQVWYAEQTTNLPAPYTNTAPDWYYQPYGTGWDGTVQPVSEIPWIQVNDRDPTDQHFEISIDCAHLGGPGATYYWNMQLRTNLISWLGVVYDWGSDASGFLVNHVGTYEVEILEAEGFFLTGQDGVECKWIYLGVLQPGESMFVLQSYHLDIDVGNWGQSDRVLFDMEFVAQQTVGDPLPPGDELTGYERP